MIWCGTLESNIIRLSIAQCGDTEAIGRKKAEFIKENVNYESLNWTELMDVIEELGVCQCGEIEYLEHMVGTSGNIDCRSCRESEVGK